MRHDYFSQFIHHQIITLMNLRHVTFCALFTIALTACANKHSAPTSPSPVATIASASSTDSVAPETIEDKTYKEIDYPTPNFNRERVNEVKGVILHHTAEPTVERSLEVLTDGKRKVGTHVVIDIDGTRYVMCRPTVVTYHAGPSTLNGRDGCNNFTIGIEFQGNTLESPLTDDQIASAIDYLLPIMSQYKIPLANVVTHEMVRNAYKARHPQSKCLGKVDITQTEYKRVMERLTKAVEAQKSAVE